MPGLLDFLNTTAVGGKTTPVPVIEPGEDAGSVGDKTSTTGGLTYGDILKLLSSGGTKQQQVPFGGIGQPAPQAQGQTTPVYSIAAQLPQQQKSGDSTGSIISLLSKMYFGV